MKQIRSKLLIFSIIGFLISGCASQSQIPKSLFQEVKIFQKPKEACSIEDINQSYLDLWGAYKKNLDLLQTIQKINK